MASTLAQNCKTDKERKELIGAAVGKGAASEFTVWNSVYRAVDPEAVFEGKMPDNYQKLDQSTRYAIALAVAFALERHKNGIKKIEEHVAKFLELTQVECRVVLLKNLSLRTMEAMAKHPAFKKLSNELFKSIV
jgi:hypothetical protein